MTNWLLFYFQLIITTTYRMCRFLLITDLWNYLSHFPFSLYFHGICNLVPLPCSFPHFSSFYPSGISSYPISNLPSSNAVEVSDSDKIQFFHPSPSAIVGKRSSSNLYLYDNLEVFVRIDYLKRPSFPLPNICKRHCKEISKSMRKQSYHYSLEMMTICFRLDVNPVDATMEGVLVIERVEGLWKKAHFHSSGWLPLKSCRWDLGLDMRASLGCRPSLHASHHL